MRLTRAKVVEQFTVWLFLLAFYYTSYRYPLQINSTSTSPTYRDTPFALICGKYLIATLLMVCVTAVGILPLSKVRIRKPAYFAAYLYLAIIPIAYGLLAKDELFIETGFFFFVPMLFHLMSANSVRVRKLDSLMRYALPLAIIVEIIQVGLFVATGRLPALAWPGSISVRFGSFLDDPNGFGVLIALFAGYAMIRYSGWRRLLALGLLMACLLATQSLSCIAVVPLTLILAATTVLINRPRSAGKAIAGCLLIIAAMVLALLPYRSSIMDTAREIQSLKAMSISGHAKSLDVAAKKGVIDYLGLSPASITLESGYASMATQLGIMYVLIYLGVGLASLLRYWKLLLNAKAPGHVRAFASGAVCFILSAYLITVNLPIQRIFPINLLMLLILGLMSSDALAIKDGPSHSSPSGAEGSSSL